MPVLSLILDASQFPVGARTAKQALDSILQSARRVDTGVTDLERKFSSFSRSSRDSFAPAAREARGAGAAFDDLAREAADLARSGQSDLGRFGSSARQAFLQLTAGVRGVVRPTADAGDALARLASEATQPERALRRLAGAASDVGRQVRSGIEPAGAAGSRALTSLRASSSEAAAGVSGLSARVINLRRDSTGAFSAVGTNSSQALAQITQGTAQTGRAIEAFGRSSQTNLRATSVAFGTISQSAAQAVNALRTTQAAGQGAAQGIGASARASGEAVNRLRGQLDRAADSARTFTPSATEVNRAVLRMGETMLRTERAINTLAQRTGSAGDGLNRVSGAARRASDAAANADRRFRGFGSTMLRVRNVLFGLAGGFTAVAGTRLALRTVAEFEDVISQVGAVTGETGAGLQRLSDTAREFGATTRFTAIEAGEGLVFLGRAGFEAQEAIDALPATLDLASAGQLELGDSADIASNILRQFGLAVSETSRVADTLVVTANRSNTSVSQLSEALVKAGPIAAVTGISLEDTAAAIGKLGDAGIQGEEAGTALRGVFASLLDPAADARAVLAEFGLSAEDVNPSIVGLSEAMRRLAPALRDPTNAFQIFNRRQAGAAAILSQTTFEMDELSATSASLSGEANRVATVMEDNLGGSFRRLRSAVADAAIAMGGGEDGFSGVLRDVADFSAVTIRILSGNRDAFNDAGFAARDAALAVKTLTGALVAAGATAATLKLLSLAAGGATGAALTLGAAATGAGTAIAAAFTGPVGIALAAGAALAAGVELVSRRIIAQGEDIVTLNAEYEGSISKTNELRDAQTQLADAIENAFVRGDTVSQIKLIEQQIEGLADVQQEVINGADRLSAADIAPLIGKSDSETLRLLIDQLRELGQSDAAARLAADFENLQFSDEFSNADVQRFIQGLSDDLSDQADVLRGVILEEEKGAESKDGLGRAADDAGSKVDGFIQKLRDERDLLGETGLAFDQLQAKQRAIALDPDVSESQLEALAEEVRLSFEASEAQEELGRARKEAAEAVTRGERLDGFIQNLEEERELIGLQGLELEQLQARRRALAIDPSASSVQLEALAQEVELSFRAREAQEQLAEARRQAGVAAQNSSQSALEAALAQQAADREAFDFRADLLDDLEFEESLIGKSNAQRQTAIRLRRIEAEALRLGLDAQDLDLDKLEERILKNEELNESQGRTLDTAFNLTRALQTSAAGVGREGAAAITSLIDQTEKFEDAAERALRNISQLLIEELFTKNIAGSLGGLFGSFFNVSPGAPGSPVPITGSSFGATAFPNASAGATTVPGATNQQSQQQATVLQQNTFNIQTPDSDSFRKSVPQINRELQEQTGAGTV